MGIFSVFKRNDKKTKKMEIKEQTIEEARSYYSAFDFEWIKGDHNTAVESYKNVTQLGDSFFIEFQSGNRINTEFLDEFMIIYPAQPKNKPSKTFPEIPGNVEIKDKFSVTSIVYEDQKNIDTDSPIYKLLRKQKKNMVEVSIKIKLNLPPKELYSVLLDSFEDAEVEIIDFVLDGVDIQTIKDSLSASVKMNYYSEKNKQLDSKKETNKKQQEDE